MMKLRYPGTGSTRLALFGSYDISQIRVQLHSTCHVGHLIFTLWSVHVSHYAPIKPRLWRSAVVQVGLISIGGGCQLVLHSRANEQSKSFPALHLQGIKLHWTLLKLALRRRELKEWLTQRRRGSRHLLHHFVLKKKKKGAQTNKDRMIN